MQGPLSTWVEMECCSELLSHLLLGFELECYLPYEYCTLYWWDLVHRELATVIPSVYHVE